MINFQIDYAEGAHPTIMSALMQTNMLQTPGYGTDYYCQQAKEYIQTYLNPTKCDIHFLMGGTQTNLTFISHVLRPYEAVKPRDTKSSKYQVLMEKSRLKHYKKSLPLITRYTC